MKRWVRLLKEIFNFWKVFWDAELFKIEVVFLLPVKALLIVGHNVSVPILFRPSASLNPIVLDNLYSFNKFMLFLLLVDKWVQECVGFGILKFFKSASLIKPTKKTLFLICGTPKSAEFRVNFIIW